MIGLALLALLAGLVVLWSNLCKVARRCEEITQAYDELEDCHNELVDKHNTLCEEVEMFAIKVQMGLQDIRKSLE